MPGAAAISRLAAWGSWTMIMGLSLPDAAGAASVCPRKQENRGSGISGHAVERIVLPAQTPNGPTGTGCPAG